MCAAKNLQNLPNRLLARLTKREHTLLSPHLEDVKVAHKQVLYEPDVPIEHVYFPAAGCVASIVTVMRDGTAVETATVGNEGMVGTSIVLGASSMHDKAFCQVAGNALRIKAETLSKEMKRLPTLRRLLNLYMQGLVVQFTQGVACNRLHTVEQRCARWILMMHDRVGSDSFRFTHEFLATMLAVRRPGVSEVAGKLQQAGFIKYVHGNITITDRKGLESASCECYAAIASEFKRLFGNKAGG